MTILGFILSLIFGSLIGSFLNVVILRLPAGQVLTGRSHCPNCRQVLGVFDLLPVLSFLFLGGRCRYCHKKISGRYAIIELLTGLLFAFAWIWLKPMSPAGFAFLLQFWLIISILIVVFAVDLEHFLILDSVIVFGVVAAALFNLTLSLLTGQPVFSLHGIFISGILAAPLAALPFWLIWFFSKGQWMGFGDVKLALFLGMALGLPLAFVALMVAVLSGGIISIFLLAFKVKKLKSRIPFGTFLSFGALVALFYGEKLLHWYLAILGF